MIFLLLFGCSVFWEGEIGGLCGIYMIEASDPKALSLTNEGAVLQQSCNQLSAEIF